MIFGEFLLYMYNFFNNILSLVSNIHPSAVSFTKEIQYLTCKTFTFNTKYQNTKGPYQKVVQMGRNIQLV